MKDKLVKVLEIWETEGEYPFRVAKDLKCIIANGLPIYLKEGLILERTKRTKQEVGKIFSNVNNLQEQSK